METQASHTERLRGEIELLFQPSESRPQMREGRNYFGHQ